MDIFLIIIIGIIFIHCWYTLFIEISVFFYV